LLWDLLLTITVMGVIYVQHLTIVNQKRNLFILAEKIKKISERPNININSQLGNPKIIQGELDMIHDGKRATVKAIFYPKKIV